jgi:predicted AAA+ superfamily ATPase
MNQAITQSLAGRVGILTLLPLSLKELTTNKLLPAKIESLMYNGTYPRLHDKKLKPERLFPSYIQSYIERDVRQLLNVGDLGAFQKFLQLCAARIANQLNLTEFAATCGISATTARRWLSVLEASYIVFLLEPHFENFNKRLTKMPKLYFYDTGLACNLLRITSPQDLIMNKYFGPLFECFIISDLAKQYFNHGIRPPLYFWRDANGRLEIDCIIDSAQQLLPIEIKSGNVIAADFFDGLIAWHELTHGSTEKIDPAQSLLIYAGKQQQIRAGGTAIPWTKCARIIEVICKR